MAVCYVCGRSNRTVDLINSGEVGGISVGSYHLKDSEWLCEDIDDCFDTVEARRSDFPEDIEDTPSLDPPPWKGEFVI